MATTAPKTNTATYTTQDGIKGIQSGSQFTNAAYAAPGLIQAANTGTSYSGGGNTPTDRVGGVSVNPTVPNADNTAYDVNKAAGVAKQPIVPETNSPQAAGATPALTQQVQPQINPQNGFIVSGNQETNPAYASPELTQANNAALKNHYQGFVQTQGKSQAPVNGSDARSAMTQYKAGLPQGQQYTPTPQVLETVDPVLQAYGDAISQFLNPSTQRESLVSEYKRLGSELRIPSLNAELLDINRIMRGTEDDIRNEITAAGGTGTESQVRAMTVGRNKNLLLQGQFVADQLSAAKEQLSTLASLSAQDRQFADNRLTTGINLLGKLHDIQQNQVKANRDVYSDLYKTIGFDGLYASTNGDPFYVQKIENSLGLSSGSLQQLALLPPDEKEQLELDLKREQILTERAKRQKNNSGTLSGEPQNVSQASANGYADRLNQSNIVIDQIGGNFTGKYSQLPMYNFMKSSERQSFEQAKENFITAVLRRESGAAISDSEFDREDKKYFPQPGDKPETVKQKSDSRNTAINNLYREANVSRPVLPGQIIESEGKRYRVESDGVTLTPV